MKAFQSALAVFLCSATCLTVAQEAFAQNDSTLRASAPSTSRSRRVLPPGDELAVRVVPVIGGGAFFADRKLVGNESSGTEFASPGGSAGVRVSLINKYGGEFETGLLALRTARNFRSDRLDGGSPVRVEAQTELDYLTLPILGKMNFGDDPSYGFFAKGGVMPAVLLSSRQTLNGASAPNGQAPETFDALAVAGIGFSLPAFWGQYLLFDLTYHRGLIPVNGYGKSEQVFNSGIMLTAGVSIGL